MNAKNELIIKGIALLVRRLVKVISYDSQKVSRKFGLTGPQSVVLRNLLDNGAMSSADLSRIAYVTPSNITGIIDRLENKGFVERIRLKDDRRIALITLTQSGRELSESLPDPIEERFISRIDNMDTEHIKVLGEAINQLLDMAEKKNCK
ncbi:MAG: MarR family transcriptional regulator [Thermodesulfobacteriota bacterium]|nr:MarR family transcriptional regulator [Thermodesulfobacteriota bacterium]